MNEKEYRRKRPWHNLKYYPGICLEELSTTTTNLRQDSRPPCRNLNPGHPEYETGVCGPTVRLNLCCD
jgi:hypothetical protein